MQHARREEFVAASGQDDGKDFVVGRQIVGDRVEPPQHLERHAVFVIRPIQRNDGDAPFFFEKEFVHASHPEQLEEERG